MALDIRVLKNELTTDPTGIGYNIIDPVLSRDLINQIRTEIQLDRVAASKLEVLAATDPTEYAALTDVNKQRYEIVTLPEFVPLNVIELTLRSIFGTGSVTYTALQGLKTNTGSRSQELFGGPVTLRSIREALEIK